MPIDRTAYNALIDDDSSGLVGTPIVKNTIKTVLLDPIDAAFLGRAPLVAGMPSSATPTPNADTTDLYSLTAQAAAAAFVNPTGTPLNGQLLTVRIKDNGTARALTWGTAYVEGGAPLPTSTVVSKILTIRFVYNTDNALNKWQCVAVAQESVVPGEGVFALTDGATPALDASLGSVFTLVAAGDRTIGIPTNPRPGQKIIIRHLASGAARTLALNTGAGGFRYGSDITALTQTASGKTDYIGAVYNATDSKWDVVAVTKGF